MTNGWQGRLLRVNLSDKSCRREKLDSRLTEKWLGGRGLGAALLFSEVPPVIKLPGGANKLIFTAGLLSGSGAPGTGFFSLTARSPLTGTIFSRSTGGLWGIMLKKCGLDALIVEGESDHPVYLAVIDGDCRFFDAGEVWGMDIPSACGILKDLHGRDTAIAAIGPAGENKVLMSSVATDDGGSFSRGGLGAVMGGKKLKAVVLSGHGSFSPADSAKLEYISYEAVKWIKANPITSQGLPEFGTPLLVNLFNELGVLPSRNFLQSHFSEADKISGETIARTVLKGKTGCPDCPVCCINNVRSGDDTVQGPEFEEIWALGPQCGICDLETIIKAGRLCQTLGLDAISTGSAIGCAMELAEKGLLDIYLPFGDQTGLIDLIKKTSGRKDEGKLLADGAYRLAEACGCPDLAMQVKKLEIPAYDPRGLQGMGLGFATANHGACHLNSYTAAAEVMGIPKRVNRFTTAGKAGLVIYCQNIGAALDSLGVCRLIALAVSEDYYARILAAVTGKDYQTRDLHLAGERIWNLERVYNLKCGFSAADDTLPERLTSEPVTEGPAAGQTAMINDMLQEYYRFRGWDRFGTPTKEKLSRLELEGIIC